MEIENMRDKIYEYLVSHEPPVPEIGWHRHITIFEELFPDAEHLCKARLRSFLIELVDDSRYQIGISSYLYRSKHYVDPRRYTKDIYWLYDSSVSYRLIRDEPWPIEITTASELKALKLLLSLDPSGVGSFSLDLLAKRLGIRPESARPNFAGQQAIQVVQKDHYRLAITPDTPLWYTGEPRLSGRPNRLTTIRKEVFEPPVVATTVNTERVIEAIELTRAESLALIESLEARIAQAKQVLRQCDKQLKQLKR